MVSTRKKQLPYNEGDWFSIPLADGTYALGLIARVGKRRGILLGYFFGPKKEAVHSMVDTVAATPRTTILIRHFCDPELVDHTWPIIGPSDPWKPTEWSQTDFVHRDIVDPNKVYRRIYDDTDPSLCTGEVRVGPDELSNLPLDGLSGHLALQVQLSRLLATRS